MWISFPSTCIILFSLTWYTTLYLLLKRWVLKWIIQKYLGDKVRFDILLHKKDVSDRIGDKGEPCVVCLSEGDLIKIANLSISIVMAVITSFAAVVIIWQTKTDVIHAQSSVVVSYAHFISWYFVLDLVTYYKAFVLRKNISHKPLVKQILLFMKRERALFIHHLLILFLGYPFACTYNYRRGMGDFMIGGFMAQDFSNPFQNMAIVLKVLQQQETKIYYINGVILLILVFIFRLLNIPFTFLLFAAQYHNWNIIAAFKELYLICHVFNLLQLSLQVILFISILRLARGAMKTRLPQNAIKTD